MIYLMDIESYRLIDIGHDNENDDTNIIKLYI